MELMRNKLGKNRLKEGRETVQEIGKLVISSQLNKEHKIQQIISKKTKYVLLQSVRKLTKTWSFFPGNFGEMTDCSLPKR
jgi:hypothetical protein